MSLPLADWSLQAPDLGIAGLRLRPLRDAAAWYAYLNDDDATRPASWQRDTRLRPFDGDARVYKTTPDAFLRTGLADALSQVGASHLVVCGYASEFCVDTTLRRAAALGYPVTLAADAHTTQDKAHAAGAQIRAHHNVTLSSISSFGVKIAAVPAAGIAFGAAPAR